MTKIKIFDLYRSVNTKAEKSHAGYGSDTEFTDKLNAAQNELLDFFYRQFEDTQDIVDHLLPFVKFDALLPVKDGQVSFPKDYAHRLSLGHVYIKNPKTCKDKLFVEPNPCKYMRVNEVYHVLTDPIAKPSIPEKRFYHTFRNDIVQLFPKELKAAEMTYLRYPKEAKLVLDVTNVGGEDVFKYNPNTSTDLEWNKITYKYFENILLRELGIELKDDSLIQYAQSPKGDGVLKAAP